MKERKRSEKVLRDFLPLICCPARTADKRTLGSGPLVNHPAPEALSPPLDSTPASGTTSLFNGKRCSMGHNASSIPDYRGIHPYSQLEAQAIRSLSEMQRCVSDLSASPRQGVQRASARSSPNASLCTHCHDGVVRPGTEHGTTWRERAFNDQEPLIRGLAPCNQEWKRRYAILDNASETEGRLNLRKGWMSSRFQQAETARNGASGAG